ncbi:Insulin-like growth factor binding protein, N-terminal [Pseudocohnilembus persalinus]|uniref:Insulin-like growth factor binding protein, N-terminal n=1 Tax=Pseudocohnilembus persalinus TaxID=266149 RepID=A0A0V0QYH5_PSEPJ|nr:Insulin-like growth factor binding protein, N-terminal [Pseudocohnilembus persalinus]|eukprot:KRX07395.1 Insulin-like growth factor binding protein, N-terminal [Pseudocohnilembus persalinus]
MKNQFNVFEIASPSNVQFSTPKAKKSHLYNEILNQAPKKQLKSKNKNDNITKYSQSDLKQVKKKLNFDDIEPEVQISDFDLQISDFSANLDEFSATFEDEDTNQQLSQDNNKNSTYQEQKSADFDLMVKEFSQQLDNQILKFSDKKRQSQTFTASIAPTYDYTYSQSNIKFDFSYSSDIQDDWKIVLTFPIKWSGFSFLPKNTLWEEKFSNLEVAESGSTGALKSFDYNKSTLTFEIIIQLNAIASGTSVTFIIESFLNPQATLQNNNIKIDLVDHITSPISSKNLDYLISNPLSFPSGNVTFTQNMQTVQEKSSIEIVFQIGMPLKKEISMTLTFPSSLDLTDANLSTSDGFSATAVITKDTTLNTIEITNLLPSNNYPVTTITGKFTITDVILPNYVTTTSSIEALCEYNGGEVFTYTTGMTVSSIKGGFDSVEITPTDTGVGVVTDYQFTLDVEHELMDDGYIVVVFPSQITLGTISCTSTVTAYSTLTCTKTGQTITIKNLFTSYTSGFDGTDQIVFTIDGVQNPSTLSETSAFQISTYYSDSISGSLVDQDNSKTITADPIQIPSVNVVANSGVVGQESVTYTLTFVNQIQIPSSGYLTVVFPSDISKTSSASLSCQVKADTSTIGSTCSLKSSSPFTAKIVISSSIAKGASIEIQIQNCVTNPGIVKSYSNFKVYAYDNSDQILQSKTSDISVDMETPTSFSSAPSFVLGSYVNSESTSVTFSFTFSLEHQNGYSLVIYFPLNYAGESYFGTATSCTASSTSSKLQSTLPCSKSGNDITVTLDFKVSSDTFSKGETASIQISTITNFYSTQPALSYFQYVTYASTTTQLIQQQTGSNYLQTTDPNTVNFNSKSAVSTIFESITTYTISFTTYTQVPNNGKIIITFPSILSIGGSAVVTSSQISSITKVISSPSITIQGSSFSSKTITISISNVQNPNLAQYKSLDPTNTFKIATYDSADAEIDYINSVTTFTLNCDFDTYYCKTCSSTDPNKCLSCYDNSVTTYNLYNADLNKCQDSCTDGYFENSDKCDPCTDNCATCTGTSDFCLTCDSGFLFYANTCVASCSSTQYELSGECFDCDTSIFCKACSSATECESCLSGYYLYGTTCTDDCETASDNYQVLYNGKCTECTSPCDKCTGSRNKCLTCDSGYYFYSNSCLSKCPAGYGIDGLNCTACQTGLHCKTCYDDNSVCDSCVTGYFFNENTKECVNSCPNGYFEDSSNNKCTECDPICLTCDTNAQDCIDCSDSAIVFDGNCYSECPDAYPHYEDGTCKSNSEFCSDGCSVCTAVDQCTTCKSGYFLLSGGCYEDCPDGYEVDDSYSECVSQGEENFKESQYFPVPLTILSVFFMLSIFISKKAHSATHVRASLVGIISIFEFAAWVSLFTTYYYNQNGSDFSGSNLSATKTLLILLIGIIFSYVINIFFAFAFCCHYGKDKSYKKWKNETYSHKVSSKFIQIIGLLFTFKVYRILYCRYFDYSFFNMKLDSISKFVMTNIFTVISIFVTSLPIIIGASSIIYFYDKTDQTLMQAIDALILTLLMIVFLLFDAKKDKDFFDNPKQNELNQSLSKTFYNQSQLPLNKSSTSEFDQLIPYKYGMGTHQRKQTEDLDIPELNQANQIQETEDMQRPFSKHTVPGKAETVNQAQLSSNMQYQEQDEQSSPGKGRKFTTIRKNPYKGYQVLKPISELDELNNNSQLNSKDKQAIFMDQDDSNAHKDEMFYNRQEEISFYDDDYEPEFPTRMIKQSESLVCQRPGLVEMSRGFLAQKDYNNDDGEESINDDEDDINVLEEDQFDEEFEDSRESDYQLDKPVQFAQVISNNINAKRQQYIQQQHNSTAVYNNSMNNLSMSDSQINTVQALKEQENFENSNKRKQIEVRQSNGKNPDIENQKKGSGVQTNLFSVEDDEQQQQDGRISFEKNLSQPKNIQNDKEKILNQENEQVKNFKRSQGNKKKSQVVPMHNNKSKVSKSKSKSKSRSPQKDINKSPQKPQVRQQVSPNKNSSQKTINQDKNNQIKKNQINPQENKSTLNNKSTINNKSTLKNKSTIKSQNQSMNKSQISKISKSKSKSKSPQPKKLNNQQQNGINNSIFKQNNSQIQIQTQQQQQQQQKLKQQRSSSINNNGMMANLSSISGIPFNNGNQRVLEKTIDHQSPIQYAAQNDDSYLALNPMDLNQEHLKMLSQNLENQKVSNSSNLVQSQEVNFNGDQKNLESLQGENLNTNLIKNPKNLDKKGNYKRRKNNHFQLSSNQSGQFDTPQFIKENNQNSEYTNSQMENTQNISQQDNKSQKQQQQQKEQGEGEEYKDQQKDGGDKLNHSENQIAQDILHEIDPKNYKKPKRYEDKYKEKLQAQNNGQNLKNQDKPQIVDIAKIIDPEEESGNSMVKESKELNDVSPSDFNFLNMRYDETFLNETNQQNDMIKDDLVSQNSQMIPKSILNRQSHNNSQFSHNQNVKMHQNSQPGFIGRSNKFSDIGNTQDNKLKHNQTITQINNRPPINRARSNTYRL